MLRPRLSAVAVVVCGFAAVASPSSCTCQRQENIEAKERLTRPQPKEDVSKEAAEQIDVDNLTDAAKMKRVTHMSGTEIAVRLKSFTWNSEGSLSFGRGESGVRSSEKTTLLQASTGDFSIATTTGDGSEQKLAYVNEIFFLKNGNGKWRISRDPSGERNGYRSDALDVWRSFYDLVGHALVVERTGASTHDGRPAVGYRLTVPDQSALAREEGTTVTDGPPPPIEVPDAGFQPAPEDEDVRRKRIASRVEKWRARAKPAGGGGKMLVDEATGVPLFVEFEGKLLVGDGKEPAELTVKLKQSITGVGREPKVTAPEDAIAEITRRKMVVEPRTILEEANVVAPLPRDAGPGGAGKGSKKPKQQDGPADDDE